ncbi:MAG: hypothetical protein GY756_14835, partial [bacterium]|nr:hypothetical protein [bacterium]
EEVNVDCSDIDWDDPISYERKSGVEIQHHGVYEYTCSCGEEIVLKLDYWIYPSNCLNHQDIECDGGEYSGDCSSLFIE